MARMLKPMRVHVISTACSRTCAQTSRSGMPAVPTVSPRAGSRIASASIATRSPGRPTTKNTTCQGRTVPTTGRAISAKSSSTANTVAAKTVANPEPIAAPVMNTAMAVPRRSGGNRSEIMDMAAGPSVASPAPTPMRPRNSIPKDRARPHAAVAKLQTAMPTAMINRRERASTRRPIGMPNTE